VLSVELVSSSVRSRGSVQDDLTKQLEDTVRTNNLRRESFQKQAVVDSGASHDIIGDISVFEYFTGRTLRVKSAERLLDCVAREGKFKPNSRDLDMGLYCPGISCFLVSTNKMDDRGATVQLSLADRHIVFRDGRRVPIRGVDGLPMIDVLFYENPGLGSETTSESAGCLAADAETKEDGESGTRSSGSKIAIGSRRHVLRSMGRKALTKRQQEDMLRHRRCGHFHIPGCSVIFCDSCAVAKSEGISHGDVRPKNQKPEEWLHRVSWDYCGNFEVSYEGNCILLIAVDDFTKVPFAFPCRSREQAAEKLAKFVREVGQPRIVRSDNASEFNGEKSGWVNFCGKQKPPILVRYSQQYEPETNGDAERTVQTICGAVRSSCVGVDPRLWDYAALYMVHVFARIPKGPGGERLIDRVPSGAGFPSYSSDGSHLRVFWMSHLRVLEDTVRTNNLRRAIRRLRKV